MPPSVLAVAGESEVARLGQLYRQQLPPPAPLSSPAATTSPSSPQSGHLLLSPSSSSSSYFSRQTDKRRFFRVEQGTPLLVHSKTEKSRIEGAIDLSQASSILLLQESKFEISGASASAGRTVLLEAASPEEARVWVDALCAIRTAFLRETTATAADEEEDEDETYFSATEEHAEDEDDEDEAAQEAKFNADVEYLASVLPSPALAGGKLDASPQVNTLPVRGFNYLTDRIKVKAQRMLLRLVAFDSFTTPNKTRADHVASYAQGRIQLAKQAGRMPKFTWVVVVQISGSHCNYAVTMYLCPASYQASKLFTATSSALLDRQVCDKLGVAPGLPQLVRSFFFDKKADHFRNERFKLLPTLHNAPLVVMGALPQKPAKLGLKLKQRYFIEPGYMELDLDVGSNLVGDRVTRLCVGYSSRIVVQLSLVLEGQHEQELPEEVMASLTYVHVDLDAVAVPLVMA